MVKKQQLSKNLQFFQHNLRLFRWTKLFQSFYFMVAIWVSFELRYITLAQLAIIEIVISGTQLLLELPTGALADLFGRKNTIAVGYLISFMGYIFFAFATSFNQFLAIGFFFGLAESLISGAEDALIYDTLKQANKETYYSRFVNQMQILFNWGLAGAILIGGLLYQVNFRLPVILNGLTFLVCAILTLRMIEPDIDSEKFTFKNYIKQTREGFGELFKDKKSRDFSLFYILIGGLSWPLVIALKNLALVEVGFTETQMGFILPLISLSSVYFLRFLMNKGAFDNLKFTFYFLTAMSIAYLGAIFFNPYTVVLISFLIMFVSSSRWNVLGKMTNELYSSKNRATAISTLNMIISLIYVFVMLLLNILSSHFINGLQILYLILGLVALIGILPIAHQLVKIYSPSKQRT